MKTNSDSDTKSVITSQGDLVTGLDDPAFESSDEETLEADGDLRDEEIEWVSEDDVVMSDEEYVAAANLVQTLARRPGPATCSFCGKTSEQVAHMIEGVGAYICDECVSLCSEIVADASAKRAEAIKSA